MLVIRLALLCAVSCILLGLVSGGHHGYGGGALGILLGAGVIAKLLEGGHGHHGHHHHHHVHYVPIPVHHHGHHGHHHGHHGYGLEELY